MAQTDQRQGGFRLPWSSDQRSSEQAVKDGDPEADPQAATATDASVHEDVRDTYVTHGGATDGTVASAETETAGPAAADQPSTETHTVPAEIATAPASSTGVPRKASKFMADLTRAMQAAAEAQREATLSQLQADAKAYTEDIHERSSGGAVELRKRADDDVAGIREWQKAEIARVKEETDQKVTARKAALETQLETHAAVIEQAISKVQGQVEAFEAEMARFFELLIVEEDPTRFAAMAENLPEPPPFEGLAMGVEEIVSRAAAAVGVLAPPKPEPVAEPEVEAVAETAEAPEAVAEGATVEATATTDEAGTVVDGTPQTEAEREAAMNAIAAAFEAAAEQEAEASRAEAERAEAGAQTMEATAEGESVEAAGEAVTPAEGEAGADPRLAALAMSSLDTAEAEAAAGAAAAGDDQDFQAFEGDALSKRLGTLVPENVRYPERASKAGAAKTTQVVVVGLVSVASIASFKRHLGRVSGVQSVGVSSGPDGEFVFSVAHGDDVSLRDTIPGLPGFQARITNAGDGIINVTARDPESEG